MKQSNQTPDGLYSVMSVVPQIRGRANVPILWFVAARRVPVFPETPLCECRHEAGLKSQRGLDSAFSREEARQLTRYFLPYMIICQTWRVSKDYALFLPPLENAKQDIIRLEDQLNYPFGFPICLVPRGSLGSPGGIRDGPVDGLAPVEAGRESCCHQV